MKKQLVVNLESKGIYTNYIEDDEKIIFKEDDLTFETSLISGYNIIGVNRIAVFSKDKISKAGGYFSHYLKSNGYDYIIVRGKSENPVFIYINKDEVKIYDAIDFYVKDSEESEIAIKDRLNDPNLEICSISLGGVKKVDFSRIIFSRNKSCGKNGLGKLMGEKNLKAIALKRVDNQDINKNHVVEEINEKIIARMNNNNINDYFDDKNTCFGCNQNCDNSSIKKLLNKGYSLNKAKEIDILCNKYGVDSLIFSTFLKDDENTLDLLNKIIKNPEEYRNLNITKGKSKKNTEDQLDKLGFCKFLTNKNIIKEEELNDLLKNIKS